MYVEDINITDLNELAESKDSIKRYICLHLERGDVFPLKENIVNLTQSWLHDDEKHVIFNRCLSRLRLISI